MKRRTLNDRNEAVGEFRMTFNESLSKEMKHQNMTGLSKTINWNKSLYTICSQNVFKEWAEDGTRICLSGDSNVL